MGSDNPKNKSRRRVLECIGASTITAAAIPGGVKGGRSGRYVGVAYNPVTFDIVGDSAGQFNSNKDSLVGKLDVGDERIQMNQNRPIKRGGSGDNAFEVFRQKRRRDELDGDSERKHNELVEIQSNRKGWLSGFVRGTDSLERTGLVLVDKRQYEKSDVHDFLGEAKGGE